MHNCRRNKIVYPDVVHVSPVEGFALEEPGRLKVKGVVVGSLTGQERRVVGLHRRVHRSVADGGPI